MLAALLLRRGRLVTTAELVDAIWGEEPPSGAVPVLRTYVSRLRKVLRAGSDAAGSPRVLVSAADGYLAQIPDGAACAAAHPAFPLSAIADELRHSHDSLDAFASSDLSTDVRAVFSWSYRALTAPAARLFRLLGPATGPDISAHAAAALAGLPGRETRALLCELADAHLLIEDLPGRYALHDLLRLYAAERVRDDEPERERDAALGRLLSWHLHTMDAAQSLLAPRRRRVRLDPPPSGCVPLAFTARDRAHEWCETERANLVAATHLAATSGRADLAWRLNSVLWGFLHARNHLADWRDASPAALAEARAAHGREGEVRPPGVLAVNSGIDARQPWSGGMY
ncbi:hypothetical protein GCM10009801_12590 [Streptomyces albiaxialis]|uniref:OmpR/PhoB-type domain-containing protein n=1 Tax=Streptomyces albiaxialis TaxID=329523 RepID=A0ABP5H6X1_9ACTN